MTAITLEEQLRGWLAEIAATSNITKQVGTCRRLVDLVRFYSAWQILSFGDEAAATSATLRSGGVRIGAMDLKIASIAVANGSLLLTANAKDFEKVRGLHFENWLD